MESGNESRSAQAALVSITPSRNGSAAGRYSAGSTGAPVTQEVPVGVDFVFVDERRPLARDEIADVLKLGQPPARRERHVVIGERVGPQHAGDERTSHERPHDGPRATAPAATASRRRSARRRAALARRSRAPCRTQASRRRGRSIPQPASATATYSGTRTGVGGGHPERAGGREDARPIRVRSGNSGRDAKVADRPDAGELKAAEWLDQVAESDRLRLAA